ncbi:MAG: Holliday junction branch migration protein RuvA [Flavobacteriales bacterium]|nr:Holliday junction branch migration protein RuvA [Flavobacteriales bacterium]MBO73377.1 Holliday junction branch migration protein RuvA [Flavobacteriales bacterium]|tara:strand:- start:5802 stop:6386 length:585 start_codon:yes stop_codon:yes gene_type:complete
MIHHIEGKLIEKSPTHAILETNGIGYFLNISLITFSKLGTDENCKLYTHLSIKEDAHILYGFAEKSEREIFRQLISVNGVGASTARIMLSSMTAEEITTAIVTSDVNALKSIKGIGAKSAQRIIVDLKDKLGKIDGIEQNILTFANNTNRDEALSALLALGFIKNSVEKVLNKVLKAQPELDVESLIKEALKNL